MPEMIVWAVLLGSPPSNRSNFLTISWPSYRQRHRQSEDRDCRTALQSLCPLCDSKLYMSIINCVRGNKINNVDQWYQWYERIKSDCWTNVRCLIFTGEYQGGHAALDILDWRALEPVIVIVQNTHCGCAVALTGLFKLQTISKF